MIGNDIVDLSLARFESNWQRKGFLNKIFTKNEQLLILNADNSEEMVWNLWSRKEAAYKIWNRKSQLRCYNPIQFECFDINKFTGIVKAFNDVYHTKTIINQHFIYSISVTKLSQFDLIKAIDRNEIIKKNGLPYCDRASDNKKVISVTNHGKYEKIIIL